MSECTRCTKWVRTVDKTITQSSMPRNTSSIFTSLFIFMQHRKFHACDERGSHCLRRVKDSLVGGIFSRRSKQHSTWRVANNLKSTSEQAFDKLWVVFAMNWRISRWAVFTNTTCTAIFPRRPANMAAEWTCYRLLTEQWTNVQFDAVKRKWVTSNHHATRRRSDGHVAGVAAVKTGH